MYPVSEEFKEKVLAKERRIFGKVQIDYTDPFIDQSIAITANENANVSFPEQVGDNVSNPIGKILSLDGSCRIDGSYMLAPSRKELGQMGWWGRQLSDISGYFNTPYPTLTAQFISRPIIKLKVAGDIARKEYPVSFNIRMYNELDQLLYVENVINNNEITWIKDLYSPITQVVKMELEILQWSHPGRQAKIIEFYTLVQEVYEDKDIMSIKLIEQRETGGNSLPIGNVALNEISIDLNNVTRKFDAGNTQSPLHNLLKVNRRIKAWLGIEKDDGEKEYVPLGTFWSGDWTAPEKDVYARTKGQDRIKFLTETEYATNGVLLNVSLYNLALDVLLDGGVREDEFWIDSFLNDIVIPVINIDKKSHRDMLRLISEISLGQVYCDRQGIIRVEGSVSAIEQYWVSTSENANISYPNQLTDEIEEPDGLFASLDGSWVLSEDYILSPNTESMQMGWWGKQLSDENGYFSSPYPSVTLDFIGKAIAAVKVVGDKLRGEYPVDFDISIYDADNNLLSKQIIVGNNMISLIVAIPENPTNATKIVLDIKRWSHPGRQAKLLEAIDGLYIQEITPSQTWDKDNPVKYSELANYIEIEVQPLDTNGEQLDKDIIVVKDNDSIAEHGIKKFKFPNNPFVQTEDIALNIGNTILEVFKDPHRSLSLDWRGNPAVLLGDLVSTVDNKETNTYKVVKQELEFDGAFSAKLSGRRVVI